MTVGASCAPVTGDVLGATESLPAILCNDFLGSADDDVWYSFVATAPSQWITVTGSPGFDAVAELRSGPCGAGGTIACADATLAGQPEVIAATGLSVDQTYYIRVYHFYIPVPSTTTFTICVTDNFTSIASNGAMANWQIYPNPAQGVVNVTADINGSVQLELIDVTGRRVLVERATLTNGQPHAMMLPSALARGSYVLRAVHANGTLEQRLMLE